MKSIKTDPNYAKAPDKGENCKKNCIAYYWQHLSWLDSIFFRKKTDMKFIILVSNFSWKKKEYIKKLRCNSTVKIWFGRIKILNYAYVLKNGVGRYNIFFNFYTKLAESFFLCRFRVELSMFLFVPCVFSSTNNFAHAQTLYRMRSLCRSYECMNIVRVNIGFFTGFKKIKQRRVSFVLGYLRMISWKISTAIYWQLLI